ncbi:MAG: proteinase inhibitor [Polyangiales bacterium]
MGRAEGSSGLWGMALVVSAGALGLRCADEGPAPTAPPAAITASCTYMNAFSRSEECKDYLGASWTMPTAMADCASSQGTLRPAACSVPAALGRCMLNGERPNATRITFPGNDATRCAITRMGCQVFARGAFTPDGVCGDSDAGATDAGTGDATAGDASTPSPTEGVFLPPTRECRAPRAGERPGNGPDGQVCTWNAISASTEEGRRYDDYASCAQVRTQRPYYPSGARAPRSTPDPRLNDPAYVAELDWVKSQVQASACVCCHSTRATPEGPANWYIEAPGNWMDSFDDSGLALGANWIDSTSFGAYPPEQNNGFSRTLSGFPSTDPPRMQRFFERELMARGRTRESFASAEPFGGPIYDQLVYRPQPCGAGIGVGADGLVQWGGVAARYVYVLDGGSANPGVPPNLDLPQGTRWRVDVPPTGTPIRPGIRYGVVPAGATQRFPATGAPAPLVAGSTYYLYVLLDVGIPVTRCTFTAR